jgi:hypothetical protein
VRPRKSHARIPFARRDRVPDPAHGASANLKTLSLIEQLKSRVGLDDDKAQSAAQTVIEFLKQRLPAPVASQLDNALSGGAAEGIKDKIGGVFGRKTA